MVIVSRTRTSENVILFIRIKRAKSGGRHRENHGCILPGLGTYHFSPISLPTRKSGTIRHLENGRNRNFTEAFLTLIVTM